MSTKRVGDLEISEDIPFQQKEWKVERVGWVIMGIIILLALIGVFGGGPLSTMKESGPGGLEVTYPFFDRQINPSQLRIVIPPQATQQGQVRFWIDREYLGKIQTESILPQPDKMEVSPDRVYYTILAVNPDQPLTVEINFTAEDAGIIQGAIGVEGGETVSFTQFVYP